MKTRNIKGQFTKKDDGFLPFKYPLMTLKYTVIVVSVIWAASIIYPVAVSQQEYRQIEAERAEVVDNEPLIDWTVEFEQVKAREVVQVSATVTPVIDGCADSINRMLDGYGDTAFNGKGDVFVDSVLEVSEIVNPHATGDEVCESAKWAVAIGLTESGGRHESGKYNYWGLKHWETGAWEDFDSIDHAIYMYVYRTYRPYLQHNEHSAYRGIYCQSACTSWERNVNYFLGLMK